MSKRPITERGDRGLPRAYARLTPGVGYGAILVDLERVDPDQLAELIEESWRLKAPAKLRKAFDADRG